METSAKYRNVAVNPDVSFVVDDSIGEGATNMRFVEPRGRAQQAIQAPPPEDTEGLSRGIIRIHPRRLISWGVGSKGALVAELQEGFDERDADVSNRHFARDVMWGSPFAASRSTMMATPSRLGTTPPGRSRRWRCTSSCAVPETGGWPAGRTRRSGPSPRTDHLIWALISRIARTVPRTPIGARRWAMADGGPLGRARSMENRGDGGELSSKCAASGPIDGKPAGERRIFQAVDREARQGRVRETRRPVASQLATALNCSHHVAAQHRSAGAAGRI